MICNCRISIFQADGLGPEIGLYIPHSSTMIRRLAEQEPKLLQGIYKAILGSHCGKLWSAKSRCWSLPQPLRWTIGLTCTKLCALAVLCRLGVNHELRKAFSTPSVIKTQFLHLPSSHLHLASILRFPSVLIACCPSRPSQCLPDHPTASSRRPGIYFANRFFDVAFKQQLRARPRQTKAALQNYGIAL